jgi:uncharacterized RDD family membrane protein YckC
MMATLDGSRPSSPAIAASADPALRFAGTGVRFIAFALDALIVLASMFVWLLPVVWIHPMAGSIAMPAAWLIYLTVGYSLGRTAGMRVVRIGLLCSAGDRAPGWGRGSLRAILAGFPAMALFLLLAAGFSDPPEHGYSLLTQVFIVGAGVVFVLGLLARLTMIFDPRHMSLVDHAAGIVVVRG